MNWPLSSLRPAIAGLLTAVAIAGAGHMMTPPHASALNACDVAAPGFDGEELTFLYLINTYRAENGLGGLVLSTNLTRAADWMTSDLGYRDYFAHTDSLGRSPSQRAIDCGSPAGAGENLAAGTVRDTALEAFEAWKASPGHNANMLYPGYVQVGIARHEAPSSTYKWYWATEFSMVYDGTDAYWELPRY